jgi:hypothetical protein
MFKSVSPWNARFFCAIMALLFWGSLQAQDLPIARNLQKAYTNGTRSADGQPGTKYWQNKADYDIYITFSPTTRLISGTVSIQYINNSPDTLREVVFKLYPNLYKKGAQRLMEISPEDAGDEPAGLEADVAGREVREVLRGAHDVRGDGVAGSRCRVLVQGGRRWRAHGGCGRRRGRSSAGPGVGD